VERGQCPARQTDLTYSTSMVHLMIVSLTSPESSLEEEEEEEEEEDYDD
jgi:hypothetical protein